MPKFWKLFFDGGSRGNGSDDASAGSGWVLYEDSVKIAEGWTYLGNATNNVAEYTGLLDGMTHLKPLITQGDKVLIQGDSKLVIEQVAGRWKCKCAHLKPLCAKAQALCKGHTLKHVVRALNKEADAMSNVAMNLKTSDVTTF